MHCGEKEYGKCEEMGLAKKDAQVCSERISAFHLMERSV